MYVGRNRFTLEATFANHWHMEHLQTGTSDIPLTAKGVETMERTAKLVVPGKAPISSIVFQSTRNADSSACIDVIDPEKVSHFFISPRQRAQKTAQLVCTVSLSCLFLFEIGRKNISTLTYIQPLA